MQTIRLWRNCQISSRKLGFCGRGTSHHIKKMWSPLKEKLYLDRNTRLSNVRKLREVEVRVLSESSVLPGAVSSLWSIFLPKGLLWKLGGVYCTKSATRNGVNAPVDSSNSQLPKTPLPLNFGSRSQIRIWAEKHRDTR
jgi:hypothetical protein